MINGVIVTGDGQRKLDERQRSDDIVVESIATGLFEGLLEVRVGPDADLVHATQFALHPDHRERPVRVVRDVARDGDLVAFADDVSRHRHVDGVVGPDQ